MNSKTLLSALLILLISCSRENDSIAPPKTATELLTQKTWTLNSHGPDNNNNKVLDPSEDVALTCERDNTLDFYNDGTVVFKENAIACGSGLSEFSFNWQFVNNEKTIDFVNTTVQVLKLTDQELITYYEEANGNGGTTGFINVFRH